MIGDTSSFGSPAGTQADRPPALGLGNLASTSTWLRKWIRNLAQIQAKCGGYGQRIGDHLSRIGTGGKDDLRRCVKTHVKHPLGVLLRTAEKLYASLDTIMCPTA